MATAAAFFNDPDQTVDDMLAGLARTRAVRLSRPGSGVRAVVRRDLEPTQVAVVSGGGSGHEPAHAGLVGDGLLAAAVCGDFFASPTVDAVLATIREVAGVAGCLLVVKNYTGDRINFGLAAEQARAEGADVEIVTVADDVALPDNPQPRGLAGTVLVHKVAGHAARRGEPLARVAEVARGVAESAKTLSLSLSSARLPGAQSERREAELGLGIHNEPGAQTISPDSAGDAVRHVLEPLLAAVDEAHGKDTDLIALLNDTGGCSTQELAVLARDLLEQAGGRIRLLVGPAALMTSVDMHGFSITFLPWSEEYADALLEPVDVPDWPAVVAPGEPETFDPRLPESPETGRGERDADVAERLRAAAESLRDARERLDELDARTGDGDAGATLATGAEAVLQSLAEDELSTGSPEVLAEELAVIAARRMGGSSGVLVSILLTATARELSQGRDVGDALGSGLSSVRRHGGADVGHRTLVDALAPALEAWPQGVGPAARAARDGADSTAGMTTAQAGRASYVREEVLEGVPDPGAEAVALVLEAWAGV
jgi:ATP-dependent dihydroxyacetone kinase